jgi:hypothetical protein
MMTDVHDRVMHAIFAIGNLPYFMRRSVWKFALLVVIAPVLALFLLLSWAIEKLPKRPKDE